MTLKNKITTCNNRMLDATPPRALTKLEHVRAELARIYRLARAGKLETQDATRLTYILINLAKIIESSDLEERVKVLESETGENN